MIPGEQDAADEVTPAARHVSMNMGEVKPLADATDEWLVAAARDNDGRDPRPFEELMRRHRGFVTANCRVITRAPADAEDLAQDVFVKVFFALQRFEGRSTFRGWIQRIKVHHCLNHLRRTRGRVELDLDAADVEQHEALRVAPAAVERLSAEADREQIVRVLDSLSDAVRIPLMLRDADGLSYEEIAAALGLSLSAVKMRIKRGREQFRTRFDAAALQASQPMEGR